MIRTGIQKLNSALYTPRLRYSVVAGLVITVVLLLLWRGDVFMPVRLRANDFYFAPATTSDKIVIIAIDDDSLTRYGRTPVEWSRAAYADLMAVLGDANPRVISMDILFSTTEAEDEAFAEALRTLRQSDARTRIVLADAGINLNPNINTADDWRTLTFESALPLSPILRENADYAGFVNTLPDIDGVIRKQPSLIQTGEAQQFSFSIATYLAYLRIPASAASQVISADGNTLMVTPERQLTVDDYGLWRPYYYGPPSTSTNQTFTTVSLIDVIDGNVDLQIFDDKIVLIGLSNNAGELDKYQVPSATNGSMMSGIEIQANAIESLLNADFVMPLSALWTGVIISLFAFGTSLLYARPRWYFKVALALILVIAWFVFASVLFSLTNISINLFDTVLALVLPLVTAIGIDITLETWQRQQKEFLLSSLQHIAEQRLQLPQAAQYILQDVSNIVPQGKAALYIANDAGGTTGFQRFNQREESPVALSTQDDALLKRYATSQKVTRETGITVIPLAWQNAQQGLLVIEHARRNHLDRTSEQLLKDLAQRLAPNLDNIRLYGEVQRQISLLDAVFGESPAGIAVVDVAGKVVQSNHYLALLLGSTPEAIVGKSLPEMIAYKADNPPLIQQLLSGIRSRRNFDLLEVTIGDTSARIDVAPLQNYALWVVIVGDVTALVELGKLKTQMLRIASHDLKNPLARIIGFATLLDMSATLDNDHQRYVKYIHAAGQEMLNIIDDNLNLDRLRSGKIFLEDVDLTVLVREVCASHQPDIIQKHQTLHLDLPDEAVHGNVDRSYLSQVITNLVGNAIKYTPDEGTISVRLKAEPSQIYFEVQDTGYGIPQEAQAKLFTEFYRVRSAATAHIPGTGLGLSLVKSAIEAHGGVIDFKSEANKGSTFFFTLPREAVD